MSESLREPPKFATDPWAWDYTRTKVETQTGIAYQQWTGKQFAAATRIYRHVISKYGENFMPACPKCDQANPFDEGDYICRTCRWGE